MSNLEFDTEEITPWLIELNRIISTYCQFLSLQKGDHLQRESQVYIYIFFSLTKNSFQLSSWDIKASSGGGRDGEGTLKKIFVIHV